MKEILKLILATLKENSLNLKYRKQLLKDNLTVDAFEYFLKQSKIKGVEIELTFANNIKAVIRPEKYEQVPFKSFRDRFEEARKGEVNA